MSAHIFVFIDRGERMENQVKTYRLAKGLTQKKLAELIGTSQQQIQRIESGSSATRLDVAAKLSEVLGRPPEKLFPGAGKALEKMRVERKTSRYVELDAWSKVREAGIEPDPRAWTLKMGMRGYDEPFFFRNVLGREKERVFSEIQSEEASFMKFVVFDSESHRVAVNVAELSHCHFLFDAFRQEEVELDNESQEVTESGEDDYTAKVFMVGGGPPLIVELEPDDPFDEESDEDMPECCGAFYDLDTACGHSKRIFLTDENGEQVAIRAGNLAVFMVSLNVLTPYSTEADEDEDEDQV